METIHEGRELPGSPSSASLSPSPLPIDPKISHVDQATLHALLIDTPPLTTRCVSVKKPGEPSVTLILTRLADRTTQVIVKRPGREKKPTPLGEGGYKSIYLADSFSLSPEGLLTTPPTPLALAVTEVSLFSPTSIELLKEIPPSPYLLARPEKAVLYTRKKPEKENKIYLPMPLLPEKDLEETTETTGLSLEEKWEALFEGIANAAKGSCALGTHVHGDLTTVNMTRHYGLFDYDTLRREGYHRQQGAPLRMQPPNVLMALLHQAQRNHWHDSQDILTDHLLKWFPDGHLPPLPAEPRPFYYDEEDELFIYYTKKFDVFTLGYQFIEHCKDIYSCPRGRETIRFIERMLSFYEDHRPTMEEVAAYFEALIAPAAPPLPLPEISPEAPPKERFDQIIARAQALSDQGNDDPTQLKALGEALESLGIKDNAFLRAFIPALLNTERPLDIYTVLSELNSARECNLIFN